MWDTDTEVRKLGQTYRVVNKDNAYLKERKNNLETQRQKVKTYK